MSLIVQKFGGTSVADVDRIRHVAGIVGDTSAVALAAALAADACEIYTDVDGVYTSDPRIVPQARKLERIAYDEMLELASLGAKVLQIRSVEFAKRYRVPVHVRSTFSAAPGTWVVEEDARMEEVSVAGVAYDRDEAKLTVLRVPDRPGVAARLFGPIARCTMPSSGDHAHETHPALRHDPARRRPGRGRLLHARGQGAHRRASRRPRHPLHRGRLAGLEPARRGVLPGRQAARPEAREGGGLRLDAARGRARSRRPQPGALAPRR